MSTSQTNGHTWLTPKSNKFVVDPSSLIENYPELFKFRRASSETDVNTSKLTRDTNLTAK